MKPSRPMQTEAWNIRTSPPPERAGVGIYCIPVDCAPFAVRFTYSYALSNERGECVIVDPGLDTDQGWTQLVEGLDEAGLAVDGVRGVIATHWHPDHLGMAKRLSAATGAWVAAHELEVGGPLASWGADEYLGRDEQWLARCGVPTSRASALRATRESLDFIADLAHPDVLLRNGDRIALADRDIEVVWTPGHTAGHICLVDHDERKVLTGDHVLPRISPNVGVAPGDEGRNPLAEYYESLVRLEPWDDYEALPAHEYSFWGLAERTRDLRDHHLSRSDEIVAILKERDGQSVWRISESLTWSRGWENLDGPNLRAALSETVAHVEFLANSGIVDWGGPDESPNPEWKVSLRGSRSASASGSTI